ncbi:MAG: hypothetical protein NVS2B7_30240 [Herpetosiphon sp.]
MDQHLFFAIAFSCLLTHEMDAIRLQEWKIFPILSALPDKQGYTVFTALHGPLYVLLLWRLLSPGGSMFIINGLDSFCILHVGLHVVFRNHRHNHFRSWFSWALILGAGLAGALDLLVIR